MQQTITLAKKKRKRSCEECDGDMHRIPRSKIVKTVLFWLPVKRYECYRCRRNIYTLGRF